jgi:alpha-glucosidase
MVNGVIPEDRLRDPQGLRLGAARSRDPARTPMPWLPDAGAGFSTVDPWLPIAPDYQTRNVAVQAGEPRSILNLYRSLLRYRSAVPALVSGSYETFPTAEGCFAYLRRHPAGDHLVALNFTSEPLHIDTQSMRGSVVLSTHLDRSESVTEELSLRPDEGIIARVEL